MKTTNGPLIMALNCLKGGTSLKNAMTSAARIAAKRGWPTKAVSVMSPDQVNWPGDFTSDWHVEFEKAGKVALEKFLKRNKSHPSIGSKILFQPYHSRKGSVQTVLSELTASNAAVVAVFTHTQKSSGTLPAGFVSSLISNSGVPVLVLNAKAPALKTLKTILFSTDFSEIDEKSFKQALAFAKETGSKIVLTHVLPNLANETMAAYAGIAGGWNNFEAYLEIDRKKTEAKAKNWIEKARASGVTAECDLIQNSKTIASGVLKNAKKRKADLLIVTEKTGPWAAVLLGSVTRNILESSLIPVLVISEKK